MGVPCGGVTAALVWSGGVRVVHYGVHYVLPTAESLVHVYRARTLHTPPPHTTPRASWWIYIPVIQSSASCPPPPGRARAWPDSDAHSRGVTGAQEVCESTTDSLAIRPTFNPQQQLHSTPANLLLTVL